jgi:hypothetical protein
MEQFREQREVRHGERHGAGRPVARALARATLGLCTAVALAGLAPADNSAAATASSGREDRAVASTGTVVVAKPGSTRSIHNVGTSTVIPVPGRTFRIAGAVDLSTAPDFPRAGTLRILVDRDDTPVPVQVRADGTFLSDPVTLDDDQPWYRDRHYVAVNLWAADGIDINTTVYQVAVSTQRGRNGS